MIVVICCVASFLSCTGQQSSASRPMNKQTEEAQAINAEEIQEMGLLKQVEDSGYPFATLTIEFPERDFQESFTINLEEVQGVDLGSLNKWIGRYVRFTYTSSIVNALLDIRQDGKSLLGVSPEELPDGLKKISGTLDCPNEPSGDTPGILTISDAHAESLTFDFFIIQEVIEAKGQLVEGYYDTRTENVIKSIKLLKK